MEGEDDLFFADLSKQISLLIMDDNEHENSSVYRSSADSLQTFSHVMHPAIRAPYVYGQNNRRETSKGTGVFIPRSSQPRRKNRQARHFSSNTKTQGDTQRELSQVPHNSINPPHYSSLNPSRRFS